MKPLRPLFTGRSSLPDRLALFALAIGILARIGRAMAGTFSQDVDQSVVGLMARHMANGTDFPLFFYGQSYMGSLEPAASALMFKLFGESGFTLCLGPVLFASIALWALWRWGRDAAGPWGGLLSLLGGLFGPLMFFQFQAAARGGYMVALSVEILVLLLSGRMAASLRDGRPPRLRAWLALGLVAGVGLWSNLIVVPALAVGAFLLAWGMRWRPWRHLPALAAAAAATVAGMSPWIWDMVRRGGMDALVQGSGSQPLSVTLRCMLANYCMFIDGYANPHTADFVYTAAFTALALLGALMALSGRRSAGSLRNAARASAIAFAILFAAVYGFSSFASVPTGRYWIPIAPPLALLAALACVLPRGRALRASALVVWISLFAIQAYLACSGMRGAYLRSVETGRRLETDIRELREAGVRAALMPLTDYPLNFFSRETVTVSDGHKGFYRPNLRTTELAEDIFYSSVFGGLKTWLRLTGAESRKVSAGSLSLVADVRCPLPSDRELPAVPRSADAPDTPLGGLSDRSNDTYWSVPGGGSASLEWNLPGDSRLTALRLQFTHRVNSQWFAAPTGARIEVPSPGGGWETCAEVEFPSLETSIGRPYPSDTAIPVEIPLGGISPARLRATLLVPRSGGTSKPWRLAEAMLFEAVPGDSSDRADVLLAPDAVAAVARCLERDPGLWLFAPRRLSGLLVTRFGADPGRLGGLPDGIFGPAPAPAADGRIPPDRPVALCVEPRMLPATEKALRRAFRTWTAEPAGPWILLFPEPDPDSAFALLWDGDSPLADMDMGPIDDRIEAVLAALASGEDPSETILELAAIRPEALAPIPAGAVRAAGGKALAALRAARGDIPGNPCDAVFSDGLRLRGVDVAPASPHPGAAIDVTLYWQADGKPHPYWEETTFIHVCNSAGRIVAQADWFGIANVAGRPDFSRPLHEFQPETVRISLPGNLPPGPLQLRIGRKRPGWRWRVPVSSHDRPVSRRALLLDGLVEVPRPD